VVKEVVRSDEKIAADDWLLLCLWKDCTRIVERFFIGEQQVRWVNGVLSFPPTFQTIRVVDLQDPGTLVPLVVNVGRVHFFHFTGVEDSQVGLDLGGWETGTDAFGWDGNNAGRKLFEVLVVLGWGKIGWDKVDFVAFVEEGLSKTEYFLFVGSLKPAGKSLDEVEYVHERDVIMRCLVGDDDWC
jgi:hypothetical protein